MNGKHTNLRQEGFSWGTLADGSVIIAPEYAELAKRRLRIAPELLETCKLALPLLQEYRERVIKGEITGRLLIGDCEPTRALEAAIEAAEGRG